MSDESASKLQDDVFAAANENGPPQRKPRRRKTAHLKLVPETRELRESLRAKCYEVANKLDKSRPLTKDEMETVTRSLLDDAGLPEGYVGWTMVVLASAFWHDQVAATPPERRLMLLPHCLKHAEGCPADYDEFGLDCEKCGACSIADFRGIAEQLGYKVLVAEGSPIVLKIIVSGYVDAIVGVACLNVLEKAIDKILLAGIPCMAVPLLSSDCRNTSVDEDWVQEIIHVSQKAPVKSTSTYVHLMRAAHDMFDPDKLESLAPRSRGDRRLADLNGEGVTSLDAIATTEAIAYDFLAKGGKHARPFITLAVHDTLTGGRATQADGAQQVAQLSDSIKRTAMSIETFHKASLVHDDIQDNDEFRYGDTTIHRQFGTPTAINVGDYLIGMGYQLVSRDSSELGAECVCDILDCLARSHMKLSEGQGAELLWRDSREKRLAPKDALKIYILKTSPAFEAALYVGARLAGCADQYAEAISQFSRHLGVAFQILNDLNDWQPDQHNKLVAGGDVFGGRPTVLWALALSQADASQQRAMLELVDNTRLPAEERLTQVRKWYEQANVFHTARELVEKYRVRAEEVADGIEPEAFRRLLYYLIDSILEMPSNDATPEAAVVNLEETLAADSVS